jgi:hypothetical protein
VVVITLFFVAVGAFAVVLVGLFVVPGSLFATAFPVEVASPSGEWTFEGEEVDEGALGGSVTISARRVCCVMVERSRPVYFGGWGARPTIAWIDERTVAIDGRPLDLYLDPPISVYH